MSCNLDHVLYNLQNASDKEKEDYALEFSEKYIDNIDDFISFLCNSDFSCCDSYEDSWKFIKGGKHSLERYSNLGLCFLHSNKWCFGINTNNSLYADINTGLSGTYKQSWAINAGYTHRF